MENDAKVYFVSAPGRIKIGFTRRPEKRLKALRLADMEELRVIAVINGSRFLEKTLHKLVADYRIRGEWFKDCPEVRREMDSAIAGKFSLEEPLIIKVAKPISEPQIPDDPSEFCPEFKIVSCLGDAAEEVIARGDDKYEVRGRVDSFLLAAQTWLEQRATKDRAVEKTVHTMRAYAELRRAENSKTKVRAA